MTGHYKKITPRNAVNFIHLSSCDTIEAVKDSFQEVRLHHACADAINLKTEYLGFSSLYKQTYGQKTKMLPDIDLTSISA